VSACLLPLRQLSRTTGAYYIEGAALSKFLGIEAEEGRSLSAKAGLDTGSDDSNWSVDYDMLVNFLEQGALPPPKQSKSKARRKSRTMKGSASEPKLHPLYSPPRKSGEPGERPVPVSSPQLYTASEPVTPRSPASSLPPPTGRPPLSRNHFSNSFHGLTDEELKKHVDDESRTTAKKDEAVYPSVMRSLGFHLPTPCRRLSTHVLNPVRIGNGRPLWKKQETMITERIVK
jgi:hypothetical protein